MKLALAVLFLIPHVVLGQEAATSSPEPSSEQQVMKPVAPPLDALRLFNTVEAYHLESGDIRLEVQGFSGQPFTQPTVALRAELGLTDHVQLNVAQDLASVQGRAASLSAAPIAIRYSLARQEDEVLGNPAIEAEAIPRVNAPARAALRVLLAEEMLPRVVVAVNGYIEQNLDRQTPVGIDGVYGAKAGLSYGVIPGLLRVGAEGELGGAQYGALGYTLVASMGPNAVLHRGPLALTTSVEVNLASPKLDVEPKVTVGLTF